MPWFTGVVGTIRRKGPTFGPRKDEFLPYLLIRASSGDRGGRPLGGVFWESPDIFVVPNLSADNAPLMPAVSAGVAQAGAPNTLYAHVWNLGKAPAYRVRVEFYWFNPSLGISRADANLIGSAWIDLANRFTLHPAWQEVTGPAGTRYMSRGCHAVVRCPTTWYPVFENGGHECLVVRVFEPMLDAVSFGQFSPSADRHVGQRNIAVVRASSPASIDLKLGLGYLPNPADAEVDVETASPNAMEWLKLYKGDRGATFTPVTAPAVSGVLPPTVAGARQIPLSDLPIECRGPLLSARERFRRGCDPISVSLHASVADIEHGQAQVLRVRQRVHGDVIGGYSVVLLRA